jgi:hypothetical protein
MIKRNPLIWAVIGAIAATTLAAILWGRYWKKGPDNPEPAQAIKQSSLFDPRDRPMTVILKAVSGTSGKLEGYKCEIRESKSRYNQMKQAILAFLQGPSGAKAPAWGGLALNEFYFAPGGLAVVDVSTARLQPSQFGHYEEALFIKGLIESLSGNFFEIKAVKLLVDGQEAPTVAGHYALGTADVGTPRGDAGAPVQAAPATEE